MKTARRRTFLLPRGWVILGTLPVFLALLGMFIVMIVAYPDIPDSAVRFRKLLEGGAALTAVTAVFLIWWYAVVTGRSYRLERELARIRAGSHRLSPTDKHAELSRLGAEIQQYGAQLTRLSNVKTGRIKAQQTLIQTLMRSVEDRVILVLSGSGTQLYTSAGWAQNQDDENTAEPTMEPGPAAIAAHLLAGKGPGSVQVNGVDMTFAGVFGRTLASPSISGDHDDYQTTLVYIVISDQDHSVPQTTSAAPKSGSVGKPGLAERLRAFLKR